MRAWIVLALVALGGCLQENDGPGAAQDAGGPAAAGESGGEDGQNTTTIPWSEGFVLEFTMAVAGEVPQSGSNCVAGAVEGLDSVWANVSWSPAIELRFLIATDGGGRVVADDTGASPLALQIPAATSGDQHVTVALLAPAGGSAPSVEARLDVEGLAAQEPTFGEVRCAF